jgi:hypothetical protein
MLKSSVELPAGFQLRIELREVLPPVWRRFLVPGAITLPALHRVIREVMGWENIVRRKVCTYCRHMLIYANNM